LNFGATLIKRSLALSGVIGDYPAMMFDLDGQSRIGIKDKGADEVSS